MDHGARAALQRGMCRLAEGDREAFEPVFAALWPVLRAFAARALTVPAEAEDAAQSALIKVFARAAEFDPLREALPWALGIAAYECRTLRKSRARRRVGGRADGFAGLHAGRDSRSPGDGARDGPRGNAGVARRPSAALR
ncbi:MAG TPA: sigma factor [Myxococcales bacterium]|nr:sigma factor [Myxococcales bacterium]